MTTNTFSQQSSDYQRIEQAIHFLEANFRSHPSLDEIANSVHLSKYHFQRLFKRWAGISPTQFLRFLTIEYAKEKLLESRDLKSVQTSLSSILDVALDAGLSSPSRLHDLFITFEAVTPGEYKRQGAGLQITYGFHDTPFGKCLLATTAEKLFSPTAWGPEKLFRGICDLYFVQQNEHSTAWEQLNERWPQATLVQENSETQPLVNRIFAPPQDQSRPFHLLLKGTNFQVNVWRALLSIPPGAMVCYQDVAAYIGKPTATRAVANAIAKNPIAYLIPCHRVIRKSGKIHRYRWGSARKKAMLGWEASQQH